MTNMKVRMAMMENGLKQWEVARLLGIHEAVLSRKMRDELPEEEQDRIVQVIEDAKRS